MKMTKGSVKKKVKSLAKKTAGSKGLKLAKAVTTKQKVADYVKKNPKKSLAVAVAAVATAAALLAARKR